MTKKRVFISFDFDHDEDVRNLLVGQAKHPDSPFEIADWSVKVPWPQRDWEEKCLGRIKKTDLMIVVVGEHTRNCQGVKKEIEMAKKAGVPVFALHGRADKSCPSVQGLDKVYRWTWDNLKALVGGAR